MTEETVKEEITLEKVLEQVNALGGMTRFIINCLEKEGTVIRQEIDGQQQLKHKSDVEAPAPKEAA